jgi:hypothetical protein
MKYLFLTFIFLLSSAFASESCYDIYLKGMNMILSSESEDTDLYSMRAEMTSLLGNTECQRSGNAFCQQRRRAIFEALNGDGSVSSVKSLLTEYLSKCLEVSGDTFEKSCPTGYELQDSACIKINHEGKSTSGCENLLSTLETKVRDVMLNSDFRKAQKELKGLRGMIEDYNTCRRNQRDSSHLCLNLVVNLRMDFVRVPQGRNMEEFNHRCEMFILKDVKDLKRECEGMSH